MTFPLMPAPRPAQFLKGALTLRATAAGAITVGNPGEDRWLIVVAAHFGYEDGSSAWAAPTVDGVAMTQLVQDYSNANNDNHRGAIFAKRIPTGATITLALPGWPTIDTLGVFTLTGVRDAINGLVLGASNTAAITSAVGAATVGYFITTQEGAITNVNEMTRLSGGPGAVVGYDEAMSASPLTYTVTNAGTLMFQRKISWPFNN
ncbi:hypothetical protein [Fuscibacter oryzae]|uniref:Uncharacterized protein n=1 Tax=Fuscibacter oryzae TaxID=2803939 RepID=A0A8J7MSK1_9RHOB|nr:hypothetical protein [Fuscibacter oryzae]MBL4929323.1 hypothetical protein [Fuscibacter oryzae]